MAKEYYLNFSKKALFMDTVDLSRKVRLKLLSRGLFKIHQRVKMLLFLAMLIFTATPVVLKKLIYLEVAQERSNGDNPLPQQIFEWQLVKTMFLV